jgi:hypothetical protein
VSTGKSARVTLIHRALHPVAIKEMLNTPASMILFIEFSFMSASLLEYLGDLDLWNCHRPRGESRHRLSGRAKLGVACGPQKQNRHRPKPMAIAVEVQKRSKLRLYEC